MVLNQGLKEYEPAEQQMRLGTESDDYVFAPAPEVLTEKRPSVGLDAVGSVLGIGPTVRDIAPFSYQDLTEELDFGFDHPPRPWLPPEVHRKFEKMKRGPLGQEEMVELIENIADISVNFYNVKRGKFIAVRFDGRIVESADTQIELLLKIQGKKFKIPVFVWEVGAESFSGWRV